MILEKMATSVHPVFENGWWRVGLIVVVAFGAQYLVCCWGHVQVLQQVCLRSLPGEARSVLLQGVEAHHPTAGVACGGGR